MPRKLLVRNTELKTANSQTQKEHCKWTWKSLHGHSNNEIDFIITNHKHIVKNATVLHRLVKAFNFHGKSPKIPKKWLVSEFVSY